MLASRISSKAAFTRQRTGQAQSEHYAHGHGHGQTFPRTGSAHAHTGPAWLQRGRHAGAQHAAGTMLTTCHTRATDTTRRDITCMRSDIRRRAQQCCFAARGHRTHRPHQPRGLRGLHHDKPARTALTTITQPKWASAREHGHAHASQTTVETCSKGRRRDHWAPLP